ncbi:hypothetical protein K440DRAFT_618015 [Wilcoxina mikolae CBS 423.85]|nr:hypothetical protein K440DRAFT_618015 [Wilcoxina mikolae CBS 423.85]
MYSSFPGGPPGGAPQANSHLPFGAIAPGTGTGVSPTSNQGFNPAPHQLQHTPTFPQQPFGSQQQPYQQLQQASSFSQLPPPQQQQQYYQQGPPPPPPPPPPTSPPRQQHQWGAPQQQQPLQSGGYNPAVPPPPGPQGNSGLGYNPNGHPLIHQQYIGSHNYGTHATGQPAPPPPSLPYQQHQNQSHAPPPPPPPPPPTTSQHQPVYQYHQQQQQPSAPPPPPPPPPPTQYGSSHGRWDSNVTQQYQSQQPQAPPRPTDFYSQGPSTTSPANSYPPASGGGDGTYNQKPHQFNHLQQQQSYSSTPPPPQAQQIQTPPISQPTPSSTFPADGVYGRINQAVSTPTPPPPPVASAPAKDYPYTQSTSSTIDYPYTQATTAKWSQSEQQSRPTAQFQPQLTQQIYTSATATPPPGSPLKNVFQGQQESRPTPPPPAQPPAQSGASASTSNYHYPPANLISQSEQQNRPTPPPLPQFQQHFSQQIHTAVSSTTPPPAAGPIFQSESQNRPTPPPTLPQFQPQPSQQIYTDATYGHPHPPEVKPIFQTETQSRPTPPPLPQFQPQPSPQVYTKPTATPPPPPQPLSQAQITIPPPKPATPAAQEPQTHLGSGLTSASVFASGPLDNWDQFGGYYQTEEPTPVQSEPNVQNAPADLTHHHHQEHKPIGDANDVAQVNVHQRAEKGLPLGYQAPTVESVPAIPPNTTAQYQMDVGYINSAQAPATQHDQSVYKPDTSAVVPPPATVQQPPVTEPLVYTEPVQAAPQSAPDSHLLDGAVRQEQQSEEDATIERLQELDPFYQESISRFIVMIEAEAAAETDEEKLKIFKEFMEQEYFVRGQRYPLAIGEPPSRQGSITDRIYAAAAPRNQADSETQASAGVHQQQQPVQAEPVVYHEPVQAVHQDPVKTEPVVYHEPVGAEPVYHQPVNEPGPASAPPPHQEPVQTEPVYHQPVQSEPVYQDPTRATSPVSSVSTAPYKPFRPTTPQASSSTETKYVPFSPPQPLYHKPNSPKPSPSPPNAQKPAYVPYKPITFVSRSPRRKSFSEYDEVPPTSDGNQNPSEKYAPFRPGVVSGSNRPQSTIGFGPRRAGTSIEGMGAGYDEVPSSDGNHKPGEGYAPFRPGAVPGSNRPQSTIEPFRPGAISGSNRPQSTIEIRPEFGPPRRAGTSIEGMGIHGMAPMPFRRDETFLPVSEKASDDFFPSVGDDEVSEEEPETPIPATAPLVTSRMITVGLTRLLPPKGAKREKSPVLEEMKKKVTEIGEDFSFIDAAVQAFEKSEAPKRKKLEDDRKTRQDEHQDFVDGLFADNQIGYGDIGAMDDEFAKKEEKIRKADETAEYSRYVKEVFEPVYNKLQEGIKEVMDMHFKASGELLAIAVTGRDRWIADGRPELESVLQMLVRIDGIVERRHAKVHEAILARDRKFRRTVTEPLRVKNDLKKVMNMIKHFDESEKRLMIDAARQKLSRTQALTSMIERYVGVGLERDTAYIDAITKEINNILSQLPGPPSEYKGDQVHLKEELSRAHATLKSCLQTAENLMKVHHVTLLVGNAARHELEIAEKGETAEGEEQARKEDEIVDCELKERIDTWNSEKGVVIGNLEMVLDGLKHAKATTGSSSPRQIEMGRRSRAGSRAATPVGVTPLNIGRLSPRPHSRQGSFSSVGPMSPLSPSGLPGPAQQLSALERAKLRNQGGNVIPYT